MKVQTQHIAFTIPAHKKESYIQCAKDIFATYPEVHSFIEAHHTSQGVFLSMKFITRDKPKLTILLHTIVKFMLIQIKLEDLVEQRFITTYDLVYIRNIFLVSIDNGLPLSYEQLQKLIEGKSPITVH
ncbi:hypothetical protein IT409_00770 [Candidatus Falkowbacteria bacterium]|nr:hypothetical protein [Candidatus Falkowbacteria bacterium]